MNIVIYKALCGHISLILVKNRKQQRGAKAWAKTKVVKFRVKNVSENIFLTEMFIVLIPFTEKKSLIVIYGKIKELNHVCTTALLFSRRINFPEFLQVTITANSHN